MWRLKRFVRLSGEERSLLLQATMIVAAVRVGLWLLPLAAVQRYALRAGEKPAAAHPVERLVWSVRSVSRCLPGATCLTQALAGQALLARSGRNSRVQIGVAKAAAKEDGRGGFESHAWLIFGDKVVLGGPQVDRYTSMIAWEAKQ